MKILELYHCLESIRRELGGDYAPQQLSILLLCSVNEGITHPDLAQYLNMPQPTVSRNVRKLELGYEFVLKRDEVSAGTRRNAVYLTEKGKAFVKRIKIMLEDNT